MHKFNVSKAEEEIHELFETIEELQQEEKELQKQFDPENAISDESMVPRCPECTALAYQC